MNSVLKGYAKQTITRVQQQQFSMEEDEVVQEYPVALVYNGISHAVMMVTPVDLIEFAKGFSLSEGIIPTLAQLYSIELTVLEGGVQLDLHISNEAFHHLKAQRRMLVGRTGCGLCGIESLKQLHFDLPKVMHAAQSKWLKFLPKMMRELKTRQSINAVTGGAHAAGWVEQGELIAVFEDVGRHNALDKLIGFIAQEQRDLAQGFVVMTSRASYELVRKCAMLNIAMLATISAPTTMAIDLARTADLTLASFCRADGFVLYHSSLIENQSL